MARDLDREARNKALVLEAFDALQDEATKAESKSRLPMFGATFPQ
jgi:hypothetical protein